MVSFENYIFLAIFSMYNNLSTLLEAFITTKKINYELHDNETKPFSCHETSFVETIIKYLH